MSSNKYPEVLPVEVGYTDLEEQQHCRSSLAPAIEDNLHKAYSLEQLAVQQIQDSRYCIRNLKKVILSLLTISRMWRWRAFDVFTYYYRPCLRLWILYTRVILRSKNKWRIWLIFSKTRSFHNEKYKLFYFLMTNGNGVRTMPTWHGGATPVFLFFENVSIDFSISVRFIQNVKTFFFIQRKIGNYQIIYNKL